MRLSNSSCTGFQKMAASSAQREVPIWPFEVLSGVRTPFWVAKSRSFCSGLMARINNFGERGWRALEVDVLKRAWRSIPSISGFKRLKEVCQIYCTESFVDIQFEEERGYFFCSMQLAHHILGVEEVVLDASLFNKSTLTRGDQCFKVWSRPICQ